MSRPAADRPTPIGIDFGTTTSLVATLGDGQSGENIRVVPNRHGNRFTPTALYFGDEILVGEEAVARASDEQGDFVDAYKRDIGQPHFHRQIRDYWAPPEVLAAYTLSRLKEDAEATVGKLGKAIVTVPAYYDERRRHATIAAGKLAGLDVADLINEPTAAALSHLYENRQRGETPVNFQLPDKRLMVYDLGGGTFDVSILKASGRSFQTLATDGDVRLGGRDFDERLVNHIADQFVAAHNIDPRADWKSLYALMCVCRDIKHYLSDHESATTKYGFAGKQIEIKISRYEFEELAEPLIDRTLTTCAEVLRAAELKWADIDDVLLVGGSSRIPFVAECIRAKTGKTPRLVDAPEEAVARGAAIYAATQTGDDLPPLKVVNVNAHSLGVPGVDVATGNRINRILIPRNTPLPASATRRYVTKHADQSTVMVSLLEGESDNPRHCTRVANCVAQLEAGLPARTEVVVTCRYDSNGTISATAIVPSTRARAHVEVQREGMVELDPLTTWTCRLIQGEEPEVPTPTGSNNYSGRESAWQGSKRLLSEMDQLYSQLGETCRGLAVPGPAEPARLALESAEQELAATRELHGVVNMRLQTESDERPRIRMQSDATLLGMYARQTESTIARLKVALGKECAQLDFFPDRTAVSREALRQRREALEAMA